MILIQNGFKILGIPENDRKTVGGGKVRDRKGRGELSM